MILNTKGISNNTMCTLAHPPHCYNAQKVEFISVKRNLFPQPPPKFCKMPKMKRK